MTFDPGQIPALLRQGGQYAIGAASLAVFLGAIDADTSMKAVAAIHDVIDGLTQAVSGLKALVVIVGPVAAGFIGKAAFFRSSSASKIADVHAMATDLAQPAAPEAKEALKAAASSLPNTLVVGTAPGSNTTALANKIASMQETGTVLATPAIAAATVSDKVVAPLPAAA